MFGDTEAITLLELTWFPERLGGFFYIKKQKPLLI